MFVLRLHKIKPFIVVISQVMERQKKYNFCKKKIIAIIIKRNQNKDVLVTLLKVAFLLDQTSTIAQGDRYLFQKCHEIWLKPRTYFGFCIYIICLIILILILIRNCDMKFKILNLWKLIMNLSHFFFVGKHYTKKDDNQVALKWIIYLLSLNQILIQLRMELCSIVFTSIQTHFAIQENH